MYQNHLEKLSRTRLDDVLLDEGVLERSRIMDAQAEQELTGKTLSQILLDRDAIDEWDLAKLVCLHYALPFVDITDLTLGTEVDDVLPIDLMLDAVVLPLARFGNTFTLAVAEMPAPERLDQIIERSGLTPFLYVAVRRQIVEAIEAQAKRKGVVVEARPKPVLDVPESAMPSVQHTPPGMQVSVAAAQAMQAIEAFTAGAAVEEGGLIPTTGMGLCDMKLSASVTIRSKSASRSQADASSSGQAEPAPSGKSESSWESIFDMGDDNVNT